MSDAGNRNPLDYATPQPRPKFIVPLYRKVMSGVFIFLGLVMMARAVWHPYPDAWVEASFPVIIGLVIRFQHIRIW